MKNSQAPKPGLYPPNKPRVTPSRAEHAVYEALSSHMPQGWYAWHSLRIRVPGHPDAEADFLIADPKQGILILEVKGGRIEQRDGMWFSNGESLKHAPREQANRFLRELVELLKSQNISPPPCGIATCFPDTEFSAGPSEGDLADCVLGSQDLRWVEEALPTIMECALAKGYKPKGNWIQAVHRLWGEVWTPRLDFGLQARIQKDERIRLDGEQFKALHGLIDNKSVLVLGGAGTGKTALAAALAQKLAGSRKKVLMLCFTEALAQWLAGQMRSENLEVWALKRYAVELLRLSGKEVMAEESQAFWRDVSLEAALDALPSLPLSWDALIVDESQDLEENDWALVAELSKNKTLWAFWDPEQAFWQDRKVREELFGTRFRLQTRYRCPEGVMLLAGCYIGKEADAGALLRTIDPDVLSLRSCPGPGAVLDQISYEIDRLEGSGLGASDIAVLSLRGAGELGSIVHHNRIGTHRLVRADHPDASSNVVVETFLRFKGLERPAIIITDVGLALDKPDYARRMYIALTRSLSTVRIIDAAAYLSRDPILKPLL